MALHRGLKVLAAADELIVAQMAFVDLLGSDNPFGKVGMMKGQPMDKLLHLAAGSGTCTKNEKSLVVMQGGGDLGEEFLLTHGFVAAGDILPVGSVAVSGLGIVGAEVLGNDAVLVGPEEPRALVIDHQQPVLRRRCWGGWEDIGAFEEVAENENFLGSGDILGMVGMEHQGLTIPGQLGVAVVFDLHGAEVAKQLEDIVPAEIVRNRMLKDRVVGAQVRTGEKWDRGLGRGHRGKAVWKCEGMQLEFSTRSDRMEETFPR